MKTFNTCKHSPRNLAGLPVFILCALLSGALCASEESVLHITNAWIPEAPPMSKVMSAYMDIHNLTDNAIEITRVSSSDFSSIEIHRTVEEEGIARMLRQSGITLPAGGSFEFSPGSYHLMLFNPSKRFKAGDSSHLVFTLADGKRLTFDVPVKKATGYAGNGHH